MTTVDDLLKAASCPEETVTLPSSGLKVRVRGLTRSESLQIAGQELPLEDVEAYVVSVGMVDPMISDAEVRVWAGRSPAGDVKEVMDTIQRLSGLVEAAPKEQYLRFRDRPGPGV